MFDRRPVDNFPDVLRQEREGKDRNGHERDHLAMNVTIWPFQKQPPKCIITVDLSDKNATVMENAWF